MSNEKGTEETTPNGQENLRCGPFDEVVVPLSFGYHKTLFGSDSDEEGMPRSPSPRTQQKNEDEWNMGEGEFMIKYGHSQYWHPGDSEEDMGMGLFD